MARDEYKYQKILGTNGINQQERIADPVMELADARNVWAPDGKIERRPGFWGIGHMPSGWDSQSMGVDLSNEHYLAFGEDAYIPSSSLSSWNEPNSWYIRLPALTTSNILAPQGLNIKAGTANTATVTVVAEYWNGSIWAPLQMVETGGSGTEKKISATNIANLENYFWFPFPNDWVAQARPVYDQTTLDYQEDRTGYWMRLRIVLLGDAEYSVGTALGGTLRLVGGSDTATSYGYHLFLAVAQTTSGYRYIKALGIDGSATMAVTNASSIRGTSTDLEWGNVSTIRGTHRAEPPTIAVVPQFNEIYITYDGETYLCKANVLASTDVVQKAPIETAPEIIGPDEAYSTDLVPQLGEWPKARYGLFHRGEMWAASFTTNPQQIAWSAPSPAYKVWPTPSFEILSDNDNSSITGMAVLEQNVYVFKSDSIWQMVYTGVSALGLNTYRAEKLVSGVGCVSQSSIIEIKGFLVFLAEDGLYSFNGATAKKLSDRVQKFVDSIVPGRRAFSSAVNWKAKNCYLLACTTGGDIQNNTVLVYDYKNDAFWIWDGIDCTTLFAVEDSADNDSIYFVDRYQRIYQFTGKNDYGDGIEAYFITQRFGRGVESSRLRRVQVLGSNITGDTTVELAENDEPFLGQNEMALTFDDKKELHYGVATWDASSYTIERDRSASAGAMLTGDWFRLKVSNEDPLGRFIINEILVGLVPLSPRP